MPRGCASGDASVEDQLHVVGTSRVEVLAHHLFEEDASLHRTVEDLRQGELRLQDRHVAADARRPVGGGERVRQARQPLAQQGVDLRRIRSMHSSSSVVCSASTSPALRATFIVRAPVDGLPTGQYAATIAWCDP